MKRDRLGEGQEELSRLKDLHGRQWLPREPGDVLLQLVPVLPEILRRRNMVIRRWRTIRRGGRSVNSERSVGTAENELCTVGFDGLDLRRTIAEKLEGIVSAVNHFGSSLIAKTTKAHETLVDEVQFSKLSYRGKENSETRETCQKENKWSWRGSNPRPSAHKTNALTN